MVVVFCVLFKTPLSPTNLWRWPHIIFIIIKLIIIINNYYLYKYYYYYVLLFHLLNLDLSLSGIEVYVWAEVGFKIFFSLLIHRHSVSIIYWKGNPFTQNLLGNITCMEHYVPSGTLLLLFYLHFTETFFF